MYVCLNLCTRICLCSLTYDDVIRFAIPYCVGSVSAKQLLEELKERLPAGSLDTPGMSRALAVLSIEEQLLVSEGSSTTTAPVPSSSPVRGDKDSKDKDTSKDKGELELRRAGRFVAWLRLHADLDPTPFSFAISSDKEKK